MSSAADQLATIDAHIERHWWALHLHQDAIRALQVERKVLRDAVEREERAELRRAKKYCGPGTRRSDG